MFALAMTKHGHEILDQFIHHVGYRARLTNERKVLFFGFFKVGRGTNKEPDCVFCTEVEASELLELFVLAQPFLCWELVALAASLQVDTRFSTIPCILELGLHARAEDRCALPDSSVVSGNQH